MLKVKYLVIGAGISGLTFANYIGDDFLILEKEAEVGGLCRTITCKEYIWDYAGHFFHFKTEEFKKLFIDNIDKNDIIYKNKCTKILYNNSLIDYPFQANIHELDKQEFIDCLYDLFNKEEQDIYDNFLDMLYGKFGKSITDKFLKPYNEKLYACDLHTLDPDAMGRFFPYANITQIISNMKSNQDIVSYNNTFLYPKNGAGAFINVLYNKLDKNKIKLNTEIDFIDYEEKYIITSNNEKIYFENLINTSSLNHFLSLFNNPKYNNFIKALSYNKVLVFNLGFNKKSKYTKENWIYIPEKDMNYYRIGFYDNILDTNKLSMYIEIGYDKNAKINIEEQLHLTLENLKKHGVIDNTMKLEAYTSIIMDPAYVHINTSSEKEKAEIFKNLNKKGIYSIGRYGSWTYCSMEDCMIEAKELCEKLK